LKEKGRRKKEWLTVNHSLPYIKDLTVFEVKPIGEKAFNLPYYFGLCSR
jgi:hypothetical protein